MIILGFHGKGVFAEIRGSIGVISAELPGGSRPGHRSRYTPIRSQASRRFARKSKTRNSPSECPWEGEQGQQRGWPNHPAVPHPGGSTRVPYFSSFWAQNTLIVVVSHPTPTQGVVSGPSQSSLTAHGGQSVRNCPGSRFLVGAA